MNVDDMIAEICHEFSICSAGCPLKTGEDNYLCKKSEIDNDFENFVKASYDKMFARVTEDELMDVFVSE